MLEEECHRNFAFTAFHAGEMPLLRFEKIEATPLGGDLWQIDVAVGNDRLIPSRTARAAEKAIGVPDRLSLSGVEVVAAGPMRSGLSTTFDPVANRPETLLVEGGIPGRGTRWFRFIVKAPEGGTATVRYEAEKAVDLEGSVPLAPAK